MICGLETSITGLEMMLEKRSNSIIELPSKSLRKNVRGRLKVCEDPGCSKLKIATKSMRHILTSLLVLQRWVEVCEDFEVRRVGIATAHSECHIINSHPPLPHTMHSLQDEISLIERIVMPACATLNMWIPPLKMFTESKAIFTDHSRLSPEKAIKHIRAAREHLSLVCQMMWQPKTDLFFCSCDHELGRKHNLELRRMRDLECLTKIASSSQSQLNSKMDQYVYASFLHLDTGYGYCQDCNDLDGPLSIRISPGTLRGSLPWIYLLLEEQHKDKQGAFPIIFSP